MKYTHTYVYMPTLHARVRYLALVFDCFRAESEHGRCCLCVGIILTGMHYVKTYASVYVMRLLLGCCSSSLSMHYNASYVCLFSVYVDGEVSNVQELLHLVSTHAATMRLFTFGIGSGVDRHLVKALARAGHGYR